MEAEIKDAIGLGTAELEPEGAAQVPEVQQPEVTIYDFGRLISENEPPSRTSAQP